MRTHWAVIVSSGRLIPVQRCGRLLFVLGRRHGAAGTQSVSTCKLDKRFHLLPANYNRAF